MESIICNKCDNEQKLANNFCNKCGNQLKCLSCSNSLEVGDNFCAKCGNDVKDIKSEKLLINRFELNETKESRNIKAEFSDNMGSSMTETLALLVSKNFEQKQLSNGLNNDLNQNEEKVFDIEGEIIEKIKTGNGESSKTMTIENLFREKEGKLDLLVTDLKANVKIDYAMRLTYLIVLFYKSKGNEYVAKSVINSLLNYFGVNDGNYRRKFAKSKAHFMVDSGRVEFRPAGIEQAESYLKEVLDEEKIGSWKLGDLKSGSVIKKSKNNKKDGNSEAIEKKSKSSSQSIKLVSELNLHPSNKKSLKDFYADFDIKTNFERNLLFTYYITKILGSSECGLSHIYTCYKEIGHRVPNALYQSLKDTQNEKGWIDTKNIDKISIPTKGENAITHDLNRK